MQVSKLQYNCDALVPFVQFNNLAPMEECYF